MSYIATIGLEVHVQLKTRSKMFCASPVEFGAEPSAHTCPVCLGLPGALPVINGEALRMTLLTGLMLGCDIAQVSKFDRKNYFYPDMPKNYQISQYDMPLCINGSVQLQDLAYPKDAQKNIATPDKQVHLVRIHLEEDVAKSFHFQNSTGIDFNRAGTPLMEIVTQPEINSPEEAFAFLTSLKQILIYGEVSDADMEKGQLRCDCNVSVRRENQNELGAKIEIKNMNSISGVRRALTYEIGRQIAVLESGQQLEQETRGWDDAAGETFLMRTKEFAHDYRLIPIWYQWKPNRFWLRCAIVYRSCRKPNVHASSNDIRSASMMPPCWRTIWLWQNTLKQQRRAQRSRRTSRTGFLTICRMHLAVLPKR
jgi:aspartyl-tRNA(Asn)/glutamyl-tRNA(Gln) amidotransferase subunit B